MTRPPKHQASRKNEPPKEPLALNHPVAYTICAMVYGGRCRCRDAQRNHVCEVMFGAARNARVIIEAQATK